MKKRLLAPTLLLLGALSMSHAAPAKFRDLKQEFMKQKSGDANDKFKEVVEKLVETKDKKAIRLLVDEGLTILNPSRRQTIAKALVGAKEKAALDIYTKALKSSKSVPAKTTLCGILASKPDKKAAQALSKALSDKLDAVRAAAATALASHPNGKDHKPQLKRLLKDDSIRVQFAVAKALSKLGDSVKGYQQNWLPTGFPNKIWSSDLVIAFDSSDAMFEERLTPIAKKANPKAKKPRRKKSNTADKPKPVNAMAYLVPELKKLVQTLEKPQNFQLASFNSSPKRFDKKAMAGKKRNVESALEWLDGKFRGARDRDVWRVVRDFEDSKLDDMLLIIAGVQNGGITKDKEVAAKKIIESANRNGTRIHTIVIELPTKIKASNREDSARIDQKRNEIRDFAQLISSSTDGHYAAWALPAFKAPEGNASAKPDSSSGSKGDSGTSKKGNDKKDAKKDTKNDDDSYSPPEATNGRYTSGDISQIRKDIKSALKDPEKKRSISIISALGQIKHPKVAEFVIKEGVMNRVVSFSEASIGALAKNSSEKVLEIVISKLKKARKSNEQMLLVRCLCADAKGMAKALTPVVTKLEKDPQRFALEVLAGRPATELEDAKKLFKRKMTKVTGLARKYVDVILGKGKMPVAQFKGGHYLPDAAAADSVALVVDTHKDVTVLLDKRQEKAKADDKKKRKKRGKKDKKDEMVTVEVNRLDAMIQESNSYLRKLANGNQSANVIAIGDSPAKSFAESTTFDDAKIDDLNSWLRVRTPAIKRDVYAALKRALDDPKVEEICLMVSGLPVRAKISDVSDLCNAVEKLNRYRQVRIHVTVVFGLHGAADLGDIAKAARADTEDRLKDYYRALADRNRGQFQMAMAAPPQEKKAEKDSNKK